MDQEIEMRKAHESLANMLSFGMPKELAKINKAVYDAHVEAGFTEEQAMEIVKEIIRSGKIN